MIDPLLHPQTEAALAQLSTHPAHAILITGPSGIGKGSVAWLFISNLLKIAPEKLENHPYFKKLQSEDGRSIKIEAIRELEHFLSLKVPNASNVARVVFIDDAHLLTEEAQNALLKTLEEPPFGTVLVLTSAHEQALLPTIRSRVQKLIIVQPATDAVTAYFKEKGYDAKKIAQAMMMSGGLPGLMQALLADDEAHPLVTATATARELLQKPIYERLLLVDTLAKQREATLNILFILGQMAEIALRKGGSGVQIKRWQIIMNASYVATEQLLQNAQAKLVLTNLMLSL